MPRPTSSAASLNTLHDLYTSLCFAGVAMADKTYWDFKNLIVDEDVPRQASFTNSDTVITANSITYNGQGATPSTETTSVYLTTNGSGHIKFDVSPNQTGLANIEGTTPSFSFFCEIGVIANSVSATCFTDSNGSNLGFTIRATDSSAIDSFSFQTNNGTTQTAGNNAMGTEIQNQIHRVMITYDGTDLRFYGMGSSTPKRTLTFTSSPTVSTSRITRVLDDFTGGDSAGDANAMSGVCYAWDARVLDGDDYVALYNDTGIIFAAGGVGPHRRNRGLHGGVQVLNGGMRG